MHFYSFFAKLLIVKLRVLSEKNYDFILYLLSVFIIRHYIFLFSFNLLMFLILNITKFELLYRFQFSFCWDDFLVSTVLFDNLLFFTIIKFIIYQKIPLRLRNHSSIMRMKSIKKSYNFSSFKKKFEISIFLFLFCRI